MTLEQWFKKNKKNKNRQIEFVDEDTIRLTNANWKPKDGQVYYFINGYGYIHYAEWCDDAIGSDIDCWRLGNCFQSDVEARKALLKQEIRVALLRNGGRLKLTKDGANWAIGIDQDTNSIAYRDIHSLGDCEGVIFYIFFDTADLAKRAVNKAGGYKKISTAFWGDFA